MALPTQLSKALHVIIIAGPTASGKSDAALAAAELIGGEIVNADMAQMYTRVSIGTAKPLDIPQSAIPHHLFDICDEPTDFNVVRYRAILLDAIAEIASRGKTPILVGGSLFYIKSLFFPPVESARSDIPLPAEVLLLPMKQQWDLLNSIDPIRAQEVHMHDVYRIRRALAIWFGSGVRPSLHKPLFEPPFMYDFFFIAPPLELLAERINKRTVAMLQDGWVREVEGLMGDQAWRSLIEAKGFIGYKEIATWIESGSPYEEFEALTSCIQEETRRYAKRQLTFWRSFSKQLEEAG